MNEMTNFYSIIDIDELRQIEEWEEVSRRFYGEAAGGILNWVDNEVRAVLGHYWDNLKAQNDTFVARHTLLVLAMVVTDPLFKNLNPES